MRRALWVDRRDAGAGLANRLAGYAGADTLVLGIPRGGLVVAAEVAHRLGAELDVMVVSKLGAPHSRAVAIGAVTANGGRVLNLDVIRRRRVSSTYVSAVTQVQRGAALGREAWLRSFRPAAQATGRTVILVDDGMQSGATMRAAAAAVRRRLPARVVAAVPVGSRRACTTVASEVDELICLHQAQRVPSLDTYYGDFTPPGEAEMRALLVGAAQLQEA
jgi:predicted phosphoribosyltransferase